PPSLALGPRGRTPAPSAEPSGSPPPPEVGTGSDAGTVGSGSSPLTGEVSDTGLDLIEGDMAQPPRGDDLLTIYHDVGNRARRQRIHHILFQCLDRPERRVVEVERHEVAAISGRDPADRQLEDATGGPRAEREAGLG